MNELYEYEGTTYSVGPSKLEDFLSKVEQKVFNKYKIKLEKELILIGK